MPDPLDIRAARARLGLTQEAFGRAFGVDGKTSRDIIGTVSRWERGERQPSPQLVALVRLALDLPAVRQRLGLGAE